jgi:hypothetical protein
MSSWYGARNRQKYQCPSSLLFWSHLPCFSPVYTCCGCQYPGRSPPSLPFLGLGATSPTRSADPKCALTKLSANESEVNLRPKDHGRGIAPNGANSLTWVIERTGYMGNTIGPKEFSSGSNARVSRSKYPRSYSIKLTSPISSWTSLMPTAWPAKPVLKLSFLCPRQRQPRLVSPDCPDNGGSDCGAAPNSYPGIPGGCLKGLLKTSHVWPHRVSRALVFKVKIIVLG